MTHRDDVRAARNEVFQKARELGIDLDAERRKPGADQRSLAFEAVKLINDATPRLTKSDLQMDDPPVGDFNGANTTFTLTQRVSGQNIYVIWGDTATPQTLPLVKGNVNPPGVGTFFFDLNNPTTIIVGNPPLAADRLIVVYKVER